MIDRTRALEMASTAFYKRQRLQSIADAIMEAARLAREECAAEVEACNFGRDVTRSEAIKYLAAKLREKTP